MEHKISALSLMDILESSVVKVQESIGRQYIDDIRSFFQEDSTPKVMNILVNSETISVPEISMVSLHQINLKSVNIHFECGIEGVENNELMLDLAKDETKNKIDINIVLSSEEAPEGIMRINDGLISEYIP